MKLFNNTINRPKGCNFIKKEVLAQIFSCKFLGTAFDIELFIWATAFGSSLVNPRKKSKKELV